MKKIKIVILVLCMFLLSIGFVSAGLFDWFGKITGKATSPQPTNLSITVSGTNPAEIVYVGNETFTGGVAPNEAPDFTTMIFNITMYDPDGNADLNDSSVGANFTKTGGTTRENLSCVWLVDYDDYYANYSCSINLWYWDASGIWDIGVRGKDIGNGSWAANTSTNVKYNELKAMVLSPAELQWTAVSPGQANQSSNNDPTIINNTGNYNSTIGITALDLVDETDQTESIFAENFTVGLSTGGGSCPADCAECIGQQLVNDSAETITSSESNPGNLSAGGGQEEFYYCIPLVPSISSKTYSTAELGSWNIAY